MGRYALVCVGLFIHPIVDIFLSSYFRPLHSRITQPGRTLYLFPAVPSTLNWDRSYFAGRVVLFGRFKLTSYATLPAAVGYVLNRIVGPHAQVRLQCCPTSTNSAAASHPPASSTVLQPFSSLAISTLCQRPSSKQDVLLKFPSHPRHLSFVFSAFDDVAFEPPLRLCQ
jgi:hypothetical protein